MSPIIKPPSDKHYEYIEESITIPPEEYERIAKFLDVKHWLCPSCGVTNFGRNKRCANFRCKIERPINREENTT